MSKEFYEELLSTGFVHTPLPLHPELSLEAELLKAPVLKSKTIFANGNPFKFTHAGSGEISKACGYGKNGQDALKMTAPLRLSSLPDGADFGKFSNYGTVYAHFKTDGENFEEFNRFSCDIKADCPGNDNIHIIIGIQNDGEIKIPDKYYREGFHVANLKNHEYNHVVWEIPDLPRDCVTDIVFYAFLSGDTGNTDGYVTYYIDNICFETVEKTEHTTGWCPPYDTVLYPTCGYSIKFDKTAISTVKADTFRLKDAVSDKVVYEGKTQPIKNENGEFSLLDFSSVNTEGNYYIETGSYKTENFPICEVLIEDLLWKSTSYWFAKRCGFPVPTNHGSCHHDVTAVHNGKTIIYNGGWHDSATCSKVTTQANEITYAFFAAAQNAPIKGTQFYNRMYEEAEWGLDFATRVRFGDGYRVIKGTSMRFTDNAIGTFDDLEAEVHNYSLDNFISAFVLAYGATVLKEFDFGRAMDTLEKAKEDFSFAFDEYKKHGYTLSPSKGDHIRNSSKSLYYAIASCAASRLFEATNDDFYAKKAESFADLMLECQETGDADIPIKGFFYRDKSHRYPVHFNHQAREHYFMSALVLLCETQKNNEKLSLWESRMRLYGDYLKTITSYVYPYYMIPAGVYNIEEADDKEYFELTNVGCTFEEERENYIDQLKNGVKLSDKFYLKVFPVWFSFRGNAAVHLESGKAASMLGKYFNDKELTQIAVEQLYFILGKNPFNQSMMYGVGRRYCQQYAIASGELCGEIPVGMQNIKNLDIPYWPHSNNCTYKEIWSAPSRSFMLICADLL